MYLASSDNGVVHSNSQLEQQSGHASIITYSNVEFTVQGVY